MTQEKSSDQPRPITPKLGLAAASFAALLTAIGLGQNSSVALDNAVAWLSTSLPFCFASYILALFVSDYKPDGFLAKTLDFFGTLFFCVGQVACIGGVAYLIAHYDVNAAWRYFILSVALFIFVCLLMELLDRRKARQKNKASETQLH